VQIRLRNDASVIAAVDVPTSNHESAFFQPDLKLRYVDAGMVFAYVNYFQTLYRDSAHLRA
jgi:hypothetical protein